MTAVLPVGTIFSRLSSRVLNEQFDLYARFDMQGRGLEFRRAHVDRIGVVVGASRRGETGRKECDEDNRR
jgi:hypothetical protein